MTPRKETEPTKEQREVARAIRKMIWDDDVAAFLARRDEARDKRWREAAEDALFKGNYFGIRQLMAGASTSTQAEPALTSRNLGACSPSAPDSASPSPASSEPCQPQGDL